MLMAPAAWWIVPRATACGPWPFTLPGTGGACHWLADHGVRTGQRIAVLSSNCPALCSLIQASSIFGIDLVLLNRRLLAHDITEQLAVLPCDVLIVGSDAQPPTGLPLLRLPESFADEALPAIHADDHHALVVFTSGTSGPAKPIRLPWPRLRLAAEAARQHLGLHAEDRWLACLPLDHIGGASLALRAAWSGCHLRLLQRFDAAAIDADLQSCAITGASLVPTMLHRLITQRAKQPWPRSLRCLLIGGAALSPALADACAALGLAACATYGLSEAASMACAQRPTDSHRPAHRVGSPLPGIELRLLEPDSDGVGIIALRGAHLTPGFEQHWLTTGDLGRLHADGLEVLGRRDDVIVCGGEKVAPDQVESVLCQHPAIAEALVAGCPDVEWGQIVVAALVARDATPSDAELSAWLTVHFSSHRRPRRWQWLSELPRTSLGKPQRAAVPSLFSAGSN